ncbi:hypothetical protein DSL72_001017 [Monilinia vaccinii-corymbosi]|uniref:CSC1/OSCA1-like 7TM region domain-containing protein n=1 Tax=Monilinia vaccinii-corymbosi TaxID=61207 RepID=A0A8A3P304_9HELO|nr:hypothetical protein DSL72_001017 [Monilinia vaccinii-corymbosi]
MALLSAISEGLRMDFRRGVNQSTDPRVGSSRENATASTLTVAPTGPNSSSFSALFSTLVPVGILAAVCAISFLVLRRKFPRVYAPRTFLSSLEPHERSAELPPGWFDWVKPFFNTPDEAVLNQSSLDGYLFLRFLKIMCVICLGGCGLVFPVLIPLHVLGGAGNDQLDQLSFGNVNNPKIYYVHAFLAWLFFGFILYTVSRECVYYINLRQAYLLHPYYAKRLSSRTVLFTCVPQQNLEEAKLRKIFGDAVKHIWIPGETGKLQDLVDERNQTAYRLERAETTLIKMANKERNRALKHGHPDLESSIGMNLRQETKRASTGTENRKPGLVRSLADVAPRDNEISEVPMPPNDTLVGSSSSPIDQKKEATVTEIAKAQTNSPAPSEEPSTTPGLKWGENGYGMFGPPPGVSGSIASQWIPHNWRPTHRPLSNYGRSVDTIKWTRNRLKEMAPQINKLRRNHRQGKVKPLPAAFIEFDTQVNAQSAYQTLSHHRAFHMTPHINGIRPHEIVWESLRMKWWERIVRGFAIQGFVACMVIFWSVPCALIGIISNINFLTTKVPFLHWINKLPPSILGLITGLLPALALTFLMALVPVILRSCARQAGIPSYSMIELYTQSTYFVFQVVQVFLVTTITSAASAAFEKILENPTSVRSLLSQNLPKSSNFYVSYFIIQGLAMSATRLLQLPALIRHLIFQNEQNPRLMINKWHRLKVVHWGAVYPVFTNMGVIAITYSLITPLTIVFALIGLYLIYIVFKYNLLYTYSSEISTRGLLYPHALKQLLTGVYLAEICLIGLFGLRSAFGPLVIMFGLTIFTALIHISLNEALGPLLWNLPRTLAVEELYRGLAFNADLQTPAIPATNSGNPANENDSFFPMQTPPPSQPQLQPAVSIYITHRMSDTPMPYSAIKEENEPKNATSKPPTKDSDDDNEEEEGEEEAHEPNPQTRRTHPSQIEGLPHLSKLTLTFLRTALHSKIHPHLQKLTPYLTYLTPLISPTYDPSQPPNPLLKFLHPEIFSDYHILRALTAALPATDHGFAYTRTQHEDAYFPPCVARGRDPKLWIPRDEAGVSRQECEHTRKLSGTECNDEGVVLSAEGRVVVGDLQADNCIWVKETRF